MGYMFRLGMRTCFRHLWVAFVGRIQYAPTPVTRHKSKYGHVFRTGCALPIEIRTCYSNREYVSVGDTVMFSPPMGGVCGAYAIRPYTCYMPYMKIRPCFSNGEYVLVRDTAMFSEPEIYFGWGYGRVFRTGHKRSIKIRTCFPNRIHVIHRNTETFSEPDTFYPPKCGRVFRIRRRRRRARG